MKLVKKYNQDNVQSLEAYAACFCNAACIICSNCTNSTMMNSIFNQMIAGPYAVAANNNNVNILKYC